MSDRFRNGGAGARLGAIAAVVALTLGVGVLAVLALQHGSALPDESAAPTAPAVPTDSESPDASSPPETPTPPMPAAEGERFLALQGDQLWRGTAGSCNGAAPVIELSTDGGASWSDVTPAGLELQQLLGLAAFGETDGDLVGAVGDDCEPAALRTYTAGADWEIYDELLGSITYISPSDGRTVVTPSIEIEAPCAQPVSLRTSRGEVGLVCDGVAYHLDGRNWLELISGAVTMDAVGGTIVVAHADDECDGISITEFAAARASSVGCVAGADPNAPAALSVLDGEYVLWTGDDLRRN